MNRWRHFLLARELSGQQRRPGDLPGFRRLVGPEGPLAGVTATCFLLFRPPGDGLTAPWASVEVFVEHIAPRLLAQLHRSTHPHRVHLRGRARGSVDWASTMKARFAGNQDPTVFVCRQSWRLYDLPENRLLKYLVESLEKCLHRASPELTDWSWPGTSARVADRLAIVAHRLRRYRANAYLRDVELPRAIHGEHLVAARNARNPLYGKLADFHDFFASVVEIPQWDPWTEVLRQSSVLLPADEARILYRTMAGA